MMRSSIVDSEGLLRRRALPIALITAVTVAVVVGLDSGSPVRAVVEGLVIGIALGVGVAYGWDRYSDRLRTAADVEEATGLPVLATIPPTRAGDPNKSGVADDRFDEATQVYRRLAAEVAFDLNESGASCLMITSPVRRAGRTTTAVNLAARFAANGMTVALVSADARGSRVDQRLGLSPQPGLMEVLDGSSSLDEALQASGRSRLSVLAAGTPSERGAVRYSLDDLARVLDQLATRADLVVVEAPPVFGGVETLLLAQEVDLVLLAVDVRHGRRSDASTAVSYLGHVQDKLVGVIANDPGPRASFSLGVVPIAAWWSRVRRGVRPGAGSVASTIAAAYGVVAAVPSRAIRSTKEALGSAVERAPAKGRRWAGAVAIAAAAAIVIAATWWAGSDGRSDANQDGDQASDTSAQAALSLQDSVDAALEDCRSHWDAQSAPLGAAKVSMGQWHRHIGAMNQLVAGQITMNQASAYWAKTRVRAEQNVERFFDADSTYSAGDYSCPAPLPMLRADPDAAKLSDCRRAIAQREEAIQAARVAIETWHHHVMDMNMLQAGKLSPARAVRLWNKYWRQGAAEVHDYHGQLRQSLRQHCRA
jgi:Mrp family chromosome partitioning ATPase